MKRLRIGVVQLAIEVELAENAAKICRFIERAAEDGCGLVVLPEGALDSPRDTSREAVDAALAKVAAAAAANDITVVLGFMYRRHAGEPMYNRLFVIDRSGNVTHAYDKLWNDTRFNEVPRAFVVDGVPSSAMICADRWIRAVEELPVTEGARLLIEISNNHAEEWIPDLGWYWYVPRAMRNNAFVVFCNSARESPGRQLRFGGPGHGHSAVFGPDGRLIAGAGEEADRMLVVDIDCAEATGMEASRRHQHPLMRPFWDAGAILLRGGAVQVEGFEPPQSPEAEVVVAAAQMALARSVETNVAAMSAAIAEAARRGAEIVAFPELALTGALPEDIRSFTSASLERALDRIRADARQHRIAVVFGAPTPMAGRRPFNSAYVIGAEGEVLTRYDQLVVDDDIFRPGTSTSAMWFSVMGVPGVVTVGSDGRWSELSELSSMRGAGLRIHLANAGGGPSDDLVRRQFFVTLASFYTLTVTVNAADTAGLADASAPGGGGSVIWQDFRPTINHRRDHLDSSRYCAIPLAEAGRGSELLVASHIVPAENLAYKAMVDTTVPGMRGWYDAGIRAIHSAAPGKLAGR